MASNPVERHRALDTNGDPISGAKRNYYEAGTTTPLDTYSDEALTVANANPVVADSEGRYGPIYLKKDQLYKIEETDASDVQQWVEDDVAASQLSSEDFITRVKQIGSNPLDYGAVGDGVADESSEVQSAIDAATGIVDLLGKTYRCDTQLTLDSGITVRNGTLDFSNSADNDYITVTGTIEAAVALTADAAIGDVTVTVSDGSGYAAGDWMHIYSGSTIWEGVSKVGELHKISSVSGNNITLAKPLQCAYTTATSSTTAKYNMKSDIRMENVSIVASKTASGTGNLFEATYSENVRFENCSFEGIKGIGVRFSRSSGLTLDNCTFEEDNGAGNAVLATTYARDVLVNNCKIFRMYRGVYAGGGASGQCRNIRVQNTLMDGVSIGVEYTTETQNTWVDSCQIYGDGTGAEGIVITGADVHVLGNTVTESDEIGIDVSPAVTYTGIEPIAVEVSGNTIKNPDAEGIRIAGVSNLDRVQVSGNTIFGAGTDGIEIQPGTAATFTNVDVSGNTVRTPAADGIRLVCGATETITGAIVSNNTIDTHGTSSEGIFIYSTGTMEEVITSNNVITGATGDGIQYRAVVGGSISNNIIVGIDTAAIQGIVMILCTDINLTNNRITGIDWAGSEGINMDDCDRISVQGGVIEGAADEAVYYSNGDARGDISIDGLIINGCDTGIEFSASATLSGVLISNCIITGINGASNYGVRCVNNANDFKIVGCRFTRTDNSDAVISIQGNDTTDKEFKVSDCTIDGVFDEAIDFNGIDYVAISNCVIVGDNTCNYGIQLQDSNISINNCQIHDISNGTGIYQNGSTTNNLSISGGVIQNCDLGIDIGAGSNATINGVVVDDASGATGGILVTGHTGTSIVGCSIIMVGGSGVYAIELAGTTLYTAITGCTFTFTNDTDAVIATTNANTDAVAVVGCVFSNGEHGLERVVAGTNTLGVANIGIGMAGATIDAGVDVIANNIN